MNILQANGLCFAYDTAPVLSDISLNLSPGKIFALLGPNGSGKSTLLKVLLGQLHGRGVIHWQDRSLSDWPRAKLARLVAYLPQSSVWDPAQTVADALRLGRAPYWGPLGLESADDAKVLHSVAASMELTDLMDRRMDQLSGGQRQRVLLGRCLAQEPKAMLLDEPDTFLDLKHQIDLCRLLRDLARSRGMALLLASHDLNLAAMFADEVMILRQGAVAATGAPGDVLKPELLAQVYGIAMERIDRPDKSPVLVPRSI
jgi:iron complex transport system ATP-binding protein